MVYILDRKTLYLSGDALSEASVGDVVLRITVRANLRVFQRSRDQKTGLPDPPGLFMLK